MIISIIVILLLIFSATAGYRLGFTKRIVSLIGFFFTVVAASMFNTDFGTWIMVNIMQKPLVEATEIDKMLYHFIAFLLIMLLGKIVVPFITRLVPTSAKKRGLISWIDGVAGAVVSFIITYFVSYLVLSMLNALQIDWFIQQTVDSQFLRFMLYETPGLSQNIFNSIFGIDASGLQLSLL